MANPVPKTILSSGSAAGSFVDGKSNPVASGWLTLTPNFTGASLTGGGEVSNVTLIVNLDANGIPSSGQSMYAASQFSSPINPSYRVRVYTSTGSLVADLGNCVIDGSTIDLTTITVSNTGASYNGAVLLTPSGSQTITTGNLTLTTGQFIETANTVQGTGGLVRATSPTITTPVIASIAGTAGNPVTVTGGSGASNDFIVRNVANTADLLKVTDSAGNVIMGKAGGVLQFTGSSSQAVNLQASATAGNGTITLPAITSSDTLAALAFAQTMTNKTLGGSGSTSPDTNYNRLKATQGTALTTSDVGSLTGWGTTATVSAVTGTDSAFTVSIASSGTGQTANAQFTVTFKNGTWTNTPTVVSSRIDANSPGGIALIGTPSATTITAIFNTFGGTAPVAGNTYSFSFIVVGR